jgi:hypothetical protein
MPSWPLALRHPPLPAWKQRRQKCFQERGHPRAMRRCFNVPNLAAGLRQQGRREKGKPFSPLGRIWVELT